MEHQSWSVENKLAFRDFLIGNILLKSKLSIIPASIFLGIYIWIFRFYLWPTLYLISYILGIFAFMYLIVIPLILWVMYKRGKSMMSAATEVSSKGYSSKAKEAGYESFIEWRAIRKISRKFGLIFIECNLINKRAMVIPLRIFKDHAEGERFYADLNYFWEQGR